MINKQEFAVVSKLRFATSVAGQISCLAEFYNLGSASLFVLGFYGPVNPMGSCRARSDYLTTRLLGRLSPLSG